MLSTRAAAAPSMSYRRSPIITGRLPTAARAMDALSDLKDCDAHSTVILSQVDDGMFKKLGMNVTCEPVYQNKKLYHK